MITIDTLSMDFQAGNMTFAQKLYSGWEYFCRYSIEKVIDDTLSAHDEEGMVIEVQQLELEIGPIAEEEFYEKFPILFARALQEKFTDLLQKHPDPYRQDIRIVTQKENKQEMLTFFLLYGHFPFSASGRIYQPSSLLRSVLEADKQSLNDILYRQWHHITFRKRLVMQYSDQELGATVQRLIPEESPFINRYAQTLIQAQVQSEYHQIAQSAYRSVVWIFIFSYLLYEGYNLFSRKQFVWKTISELAAHFNLDREILLQSLSLYLHSLPEKDKQTDLLRILSEIGAEQNYLSNASESLEQATQIEKKRIIEREKQEKEQEAELKKNRQHIEQETERMIAASVSKSKKEIQKANTASATNTGKNTNLATSKAVHRKDSLFVEEENKQTADPNVGERKTSEATSSKEDLIVVGNNQSTTPDRVSSETYSKTTQKESRSTVSEEKTKQSYGTSDYQEVSSKDSLRLQMKSVDRSDRYSPKNRSLYSDPSFNPYSLKDKGVYSYSLSYTDKMEQNAGQNIEQRFFIENAGLVLLSPFFSILFKRLGFIEKGEFADKESQIRAIFVLQYMLNPQQNKWPESGMILNKLLTGFPLSDESLPLSVELKTEESEMCESLLDASKQQWSKLKSTSTNAFRESFLIRQGVLEAKENSWLLKVEEKAFDVLLETIPWTYSPVKFPWMESPVYVQWR